MSAPKTGTHLTRTEAATTRKLVLEAGANRAAKLLGLCDARTVRKAAIGESLHPLTVRVIRERLTRL